MTAPTPGQDTQRKWLEVRWPDMSPEELAAQWRVASDEAKAAWEAVAAGPAGLLARLYAAEAVCTLYSWTCGTGDSDRDKALHELWRAWTQVSGVSTDPADHPGLSDEVIGRLARQRDEIRARTLARIRSEREGLPS